MLLLLWYRLVATTLIGPLAWEPPHAAGETLKEKKKKARLHGDKELTEGYARKRGCET